MTADEIRNELLAMARERLFGAGPWSTEDPEVNRATGAKLEALGLWYEDHGNIHNTPLGAELNCDLWTAFLGHHVTPEIPGILVEHGLMTREEEDAIFERLECDEDIEAFVLQFVRRAFIQYTGKIGRTQ